MKPVFKFMIVLISITLATSCQKEEYLTNQEKIEKELKSFVSQNRITKCTIREFYNDTWNYVVHESSFSFSDGFIIVNNYRYNLNYLYSYSIYTSETDRVLSMDFVKN